MFLKIFIVVLLLGSLNELFCGILILTRSIATVQITNETIASTRRAHFWSPVSIINLLMAKVNTTPPNPFPKCEIPFANALFFKNQDGRTIEFAPNINP